MATTLFTLIVIRQFGEGATTLGALALTFIVLIFAEVAPKTLAALRPERIAYPAAWVYHPLLKLLYPFVWLVNLIANRLLRLLGVTPDTSVELTLSREELRTVVNEAGSMIPRAHQKMLLSILDLEQETVEDIMVPRNEISGIDIEDDWDSIRRQISDSPYTKMPVYRGSLDNVLGFIHLRKVIRLLAQEELDKEELLGLVRDAYFIPISTPLNTQLLNFQRTRRRIGLVVDEYGDIQGLVTMEDILEEIVGEFTTDPGQYSRDIHPQEDGSFLVDGSINLRELNRQLGTRFPTDGPKTLNGLILEHLENIPEPGTSLKIAGTPLEVVQTKDQGVKTVRLSVHPPTSENRQAEPEA